MTYLGFEVEDFGVGGFGVSRFGATGVGRVPTQFHLFAHAVTSLRGASTHFRKLKALLSPLNLYITPLCSISSP